MFKAAGLAFAFVASSLFGILKSIEIRNRRILLEDFRKMMLYISTRIGYFKEPLPVIYKQLSEEMNNETKELLVNCTLNYELGMYDNIQIWQNAVSTVYSGTSLNKDDLKILQSCSGFMGQSDYETQLKHFEMIFTQLNEQIRSAEEDIKTKGRMYSRMGVLMGALITVLLI